MLLLLDQKPMTNKHSRSTQSVGQDKGTKTGTREVESGTKGGEEHRERTMKGGGALKGNHLLRKLCCYNRHLGRKDRFALVLQESARQSTKKGVRVVACCWICPWLAWQSEGGKNTEAWTSKCTSSAQKNRWMHRSAGNGNRVATRKNTFWLSRLARLRCGVDVRGRCMTTTTTTGAVKTGTRKPPPFYALVYASLAAENW